MGGKVGGTNAGGFDAFNDIMGGVGGTVQNKKTQPVDNNNFF